jgi:hypothetical protein
MIYSILKNKNNPETLQTQEAQTPSLPSSPPHPQTRGHKSETSSAITVANTVPLHTHHTLDIQQCALEKHSYTVHSKTPIKGFFGEQWV